MSHLFAPRYQNWSPLNPDNKGTCLKTFKAAQHLPLQATLVAAVCKSRCCKHLTAGKINVDPSSWFCYFVSGHYTFTAQLRIFSKIK